jgi:hypothetical protein
MLWTELASKAGARSGLGGSLFHEHPPNALEKRIDVFRAPFSWVPVSDERLPPVEDHVNVGIVGEGLFQSCVDQRIRAPRDNQKIPLHLSATVAIPSPSYKGFWIISTVLLAADTLDKLCYLASLPCSASVSPIRAVWLIGAIRRAQARWTAGADPGGAGLSSP